MVEVEVGAAALATGKIVRFNEVKGYGFIAPDDGGEDLFIHVNDVDFPLSDRCVGMRVSYRVTVGPKGPKAYDISVDPTAATSPTFEAGPSAVTAEAPNDDDWEVIPVAQFNSEITELLVEVAPTLTGVQIVKIRQRLIAAAYRRGWVDSE